MGLSPPTSDTLPILRPGRSRQGHGRDAMAATADGMQPNFGSTPPTMGRRRRETMSIEGEQRARLAWAERLPDGGGGDGAQAVGVE